MMPPPIGRKNMLYTTDMLLLIGSFNDAAPNRAEEPPAGMNATGESDLASMMPPPIGRKNAEAADEDAP